MSSLRTHRASAVSRPELHYTYSPPPIDRSLCTSLEQDHILADNFLRFGILYLFQFRIVKIMQANLVKLGHSAQQACKKIVLC